MSVSRIVFLSREPVVHQRGGSTTCALNLLEVLTGAGAEVCVIATLAFSRSPRVWFRAIEPLPPGVRLVAPGYFRFGGLYLYLFSARAWARAVSRAAERWPAMLPLRRAAERVFGDRLFTGAWDLTPPTEAESNAAVEAVQREAATAVVANYAFWGPVFDEQKMRGRKRVILMHDLLSARVRRFEGAGLPLDCPHIDECQEMHWLDRADAVLAAQEREAEYVRERIGARVLPQPIVLRPRPLPSPAASLQCLMVGSNILPNQQGLTFLLNEVWPRVRAVHPGATLAIVGSLCAALPADASQQGVIARGVVDALEPEYAAAAVCLVPLLVGSGIKIKLLEALSFGKAVVSTGVGVQGLEAWAPGHVAVHDKAADFAAAVIHLLSDPRARAWAEQASLHLAQEHFGPGRALDAEFRAALL